MTGHERQRLRLLMITPNFPPEVGGVQTYAVELARHLAPRCDQFVLLTRRRAQSRSVDAQLAFEVRRVACPGDNLAFSAIPAVSLLRHGNQFDAIFATHWSAAFAALHSPPAQHLPPVLCAAHGKEIVIRPLAQNALLQGLYDRARRSVLQRATRFVAVSQFTAELLLGEGVEQRRVSTIVNGVDPSFFAPQDMLPLRNELGLGGRPVLLTVARLVERKGIDRVIAALPLIVRTVPDLLYVIVGTGPDEARLKALASTLAMDRHIRWIGRAGREALRDWYNMCDAFVLTSFSRNGDVEGFGLATLEASACGKPVIASREGGMADALVVGETGLLVDPDDPQALADAAIGLLTTGQGPRLGRNGRAHVLASANWQVSAEKLIESIEDAVSANRHLQKRGQSGGGGPVLSSSSG
jgi:phosphatidylinositol alpha-1,6-mannosyltransferase